MAKRTRITRPYPTHSFQESLPIAETIQRVNGGQPVQTELLAEALGTSAKSSTFIQKLNASSKYGLTVGSYSDEFIELTELGESVTAPGSAEEREDSIIRAVMEPDIFRKFYRIYEGKRMPEDIYASNTLARELGVPRELTEECLAIIRRNGLVSGIVSDRGGVLIVGGSVGGVAEDSETLARYMPFGGARGSERDSEGEDSYGGQTTERSDSVSHILIVSEADDPALAEVTGLVESLSAPWVSATLGASAERILSEELSEALESARGCVFIWPDFTAAALPHGENGRSAVSEAKAWAALGAASHRLGKRLVIVLRRRPRRGDGESSSALSELTDAVKVVRPPSHVESAVGVGGLGAESVYPKLMAALVQSGIVRILVN